jgi:hypothetical protein
VSRQLLLLMKSLLRAWFELRYSMRFLGNIVAGPIVWGFLVYYDWSFTIDAERQIFS